MPVQDTTQQKIMTVQVATDIYTKVSVYIRGERESQLI